MHMKTFDKRQLGRAPDCGWVTFKTGAILNRKDRLSKRNSKHAKRQLRQQISGN